jgi:exodeoxyribonuclease-3
MKIITWNINGIRAIHKKGFFEYIEREQPDVLCVQETKADMEQITPDLRSPAGYEAFYHSCSVKKGYSGVATFTKIKPEATFKHIGIERFDGEGRIMATDFGEFILINVYFPNGGMSQERLKYKLDFYDAFFAFCEELRRKGRKLVICGDYNTAHYAIDLARPKENTMTSGFMMSERVKLDWLLEKKYVDTFRMFNQEGGNYTWWSMQQLSRPRNVGWRIDYHWVTEDLASSVESCIHHTNQEGSDHCPVVLHISF